MPSVPIRIFADDYEVKVKSIFVPLDNKISVQHHLIGLHVCEKSCHNVSFLLTCKNSH